MVFDNSKVLDRLLKRAEYIRIGDKDKIKEIEKEINSNEFKNEIYMTPICGVFLTLETDDDF